MSDLSERRIKLQIELAAIDAEEAEQLSKRVPGEHLPRWRILEKREISEPSRTRGNGPVIPGARLVLVCERDGRRREAVVSNQTWNATKIGDEIGLEVTPW